MNERVKKITDTIKNNKTSLIIAIIVIAAIVFFVTKGSDNSEQKLVTATVTDVVDRVLVSGRTQSSSQVELGFADQGRIDRVLVEAGDKVSAGQLLASIDTSDLFASDVQKITREQDAIVASAYRNLLTFGLEAIPDDINTTMAAPIITGVYTGPEGQYKIRVYGSNSASGASFDITGLEKGFNESVTPNTTVPLGSRGLYIRFPDLSIVTPGTWTVSIPNTRATTYATYLNAYENTKATRDRVIADAQLNQMLLLRVLQNEESTHLSQEL